MNLTHWVSSEVLQHLARRRQPKPVVSLRIFNLTRQVELACRVDVADNGAKRRKGLLGRGQLLAGEGLWIVPCEAVHTFGMRFAIDFVYLDARMRVRKVRSSVPPWRLSACLSAHSVLELASGTVLRTQTQPGDVLECSSASLPADDSRSFSSLASNLALAGSDPDDHAARKEGEPQIQHCAKSNGRDTAIHVFTCP